MTNKELIAQARELCEEQIKEWQRVVTFLGGSKDKHSENQLNSWTTHLAEMDGLQEHISRLEKHPMPSLEEILEDQRHKLLTKAKRLLGVE